MSLWLTQWLPENLVLALAPAALILAGLLAERHYVARVTLFANAVALATFFASWEQIPTWLTVYINAATLVGMVAVLSHFFQIPLVTTFYRIAMIFGSVVSGLILLAGAFGGIAP